MQSIVDIVSVERNYGEMDKGKGRLLSTQCGRHS